MKKHYVTKWEYENRLYLTAPCGKDVFTMAGFGERRATYRKNHVTCGGCRASKVFKGVR